MGSWTLTARANDRSIPTPVEFLQHKVITLVAMGFKHSAAVAGSQLLMWGHNTHGQLGFGDTIARTVASCVPAFEGARVTHVALGDYHSAAVANGRLYVWGNNNHGQLGVAVGDYVTRKRPVPVPGLWGKAIAAIALGDSFTLAVADGGLYSWGSNTRGQLGHGTVGRPLAHAYTVPTPVGFFGTFAPVVALAAGGDSSAAVLANGTGYGWGSNLYGQLGVGHSVSPVPGPQPLALDNVTAVALGDAHALGLSDAGVWAWGRDLFAQLGDGLAGVPGAVSTPQRVEALAGLNATAVAAGGLHSGAVAGGRVYCWGYNAYGQCGMGNTATQLLPEPVTGLPGPVAALALGYQHSAAVSGGRLYSWGDAADGRLGRDGAADLPLPAEGLPRARAGDAVAANDYHVAVLVGGALWTWGQNTAGQLGIGTTGAAQTAAQHVAFFAGRGVTHVAVGAYHSAAIAAGRLYTWGHNTQGQLGLGTSTLHASPQAVPGLPYTVTAVALGVYHSVAVMRGEVWAWGHNVYGSLGLGHTAVCSSLSVHRPTHDPTCAGAVGLCPDIQDSLLSAVVCVVDKCDCLLWPTRWPMRMPPSIRLRHGHMVHYVLALCPKEAARRESGVPLLCGAQILVLQSDVLAILAPQPRQAHACGFYRTGRRSLGPQTPTKPFPGNLLLLRERGRTFTRRVWIPCAGKSRIQTDKGQWVAGLPSHAPPPPLHTQETDSTPFRAVARQRGVRQDNGVQVPPPPPLWMEYSFVKFPTVDVPTPPLPSSVATSTWGCGRDACA